MPGLLHITLIALLAGCDAFRLGSSQHVIPLGPPSGHLFQDESPALPRFIQELVRTKRHSVHELVRAQPHLVHDMGWPEIHEISRSQAQVDSANSSQLNPPSSASQDAARTRVAVDENLDVEDEMERMVHLAAPQDYRGRPDTADPETELFSGPGAADASQEASGFYGTDLEDRDRGEEGGEDRERRGGEDEWEREVGEDRESKGGDEEEREGGMDNQDALEANHTTPDLDALIGYSPSFHPSSSKQPSVSSPAEVHDSGLQEHRASPVLEVGPLERELWEAEGEEDVQSSGYGLPHPSITTTITTSTAAISTAAAGGGDAVGTATPETDTGTDFGLLGSFTKDETEDEEAEREEEEEETGLTHTGVFRQNPTVPEVGMAPSREPLQPSVEEEEELEQGEHELKGVRQKDRGAEVEEEKRKKMEREGTRIRHIVPLTTDPSPTISFTDSSWYWLEKTTPLQAQGSEVRSDGFTDSFLPDAEFDKEEAQQVVCVDWSELVGRGYVILNMTQNLNCEEFRIDQGVRLLRIMERVFARRMNSPEGSWILYLSKPTHQQHQLLMNVASEHGVIATKDVLGMLGEIRKSLNKVGIQNYSAASSCQSRPSQTRSDYGKLFVVLVIIGSICMVIITSGFIYICWQRRLPATKTTFRAEELHFVENGCHDNPMLDVTNDSQPEMQEKKPSANGLAGGGGGGGGGEGGKGREDSNRWQVFVNQAATEEEEEQDTHL
ncbi:podocalyxin-like protein 2 [Lates japonicus]